MYAHTKAPISPRGPVHSPNEETEEGRVDGTHVSKGEGGHTESHEKRCEFSHRNAVCASRLGFHFILKLQHIEELSVKLN